jgi:predicted ferric reductase
MHLPYNHIRKLPQLYLLVSSIIYSLTLALLLGEILYRNFTYSGPSNTVIIRRLICWKIDRPNSKYPVPYSLRHFPCCYSTDKLLIFDTDAFKLQLTIARPWNFRAGQYIYLCIPRKSIIQLHPFFISSWTGNTIELLVERRRGFTKEFELDSNFTALVFGPFGREIYLHRYGTVILFATGIGIAAQLPYMEKLLEGYQRGKVMVKKIIIYWEVRAESM